MICEGGEPLPSRPGSWGKDVELQVPATGFGVESQLKLDLVHL